MRRSYLKSDFDYRRNFEKAILNTKKLGLELPEIPVFTESKYWKPYIQAMATRSTTEIYDIEGYSFLQLAKNCNLVSKGMQQFLFEEFGQNSTITCGNVYINKRYYYHESSRSIAKRITRGTCGPIDFHVWLTLDTYEIFDFTLSASMYLNTQLRNAGITEERAKSVMVTDPDEQDFGMYIGYKPLFVGYDFFNKVKVKPMAIYVAG